MVSRQSSLECLSFAYKHNGENPIYVDVYPPAVSGAESDNYPTLPAVVYFHGGSLTVGNRKSWFPSWLHQRVTSSGMAFLSADYTLLTPATGHDIVRDIKDLFRYLDTEISEEIRKAYEAESSGLKFPRFAVDTASLAVAGSSAGGLCVYLAAMHAIPKPKAIVSLYAMGGDMLTWMYLAPKSTPFLRGREILDLKDFVEYLHPNCRDLPHTSDSPLAYHPPTHVIPNYPANPRMLIGRLHLQTGTYLDYFTGAHDPSLSAALRTLLVQDGVLAEEGSVTPVYSLARYRDAIPAEHLALFPQFADLSSFPPTLLIHGAQDSAVWVRESKNMHTLLQDSGVDTELVIVEGKEHSFDYDPSAEGEFGNPGGLYDHAIEFVAKHISR